MTTNCLTHLDVILPMVEAVNDLLQFSAPRAVSPQCMQCRNMSELVKAIGTVDEDVYLCRYRSRCCSTAGRSTSGRGTPLRRTLDADLCSCGSVFDVLADPSTAQLNRLRHQTTTTSHRSLHVPPHCQYRYRSSEPPP